MPFPFFNDQENAALAELARLHEMTEEAILRRGLYRYNYEVFGVGLEHMFPKSLPPTTPIKLDEWCSCTNNGCPLSSVCAQHSSAGDFRSEDGLRPMLVKTGENDFGCCTNLSETRNLGLGFISKDEFTSTPVGQIVYTHPRRINGLYET